MAFATLSITLVGGAVGGLLAGIISTPVTAALPVRSDGRKIPPNLSIIMFGVAFVIFVVGHNALLNR
ncbi:MAG: hypothetical protein ACREMA_11560 [Longimicrobiales bacterium]